MNAFDPRMTGQPAQPQPFGGQAGQPGQPMQPMQASQPAQSDPFSVAVGTFLEDFVSSATFGIVSPDIVPAAQEQANPWAATVGRVAGNVAGFLPSFGLSGVAAKTVLGGFKFGRTVLAAGQATGKLASAKAAARPFSSALVDFSESALAWGIDATAREFVRQAEADDFDTVQLGKKAVSGVLTGYIQGQVSLATHASHWGTQAVSTGFAIATSEAIVDAADGVDIFSEEYATKRLPATFLSGAAIGLWNSRGWRERHEAVKTVSVARFEEFQRALRNDDPTALYDWKPMIDRITELAGKNQRELPEEVVKAAGMLDKWSKRPATKLTTLQGRVHAVKKALDMDDDLYRVVLQDYTGKTSTTQFAKEDYDAFFRGVRDYVDVYRDGAKMRSVGPIEGTFKPVDRLLITSGLKDLAASTQVAKQLMMQEREVYQLARSAYKTEWDEQWRALGGMKGKDPVTGIDHASLDLYRRVEQRDPAGLNAKQRAVYDDYLTIQANYHKRLNEVELAMGKKDPADPTFDKKKDVPITNEREAYIRHLIDRPAMIREDRQAELPNDPGEMDFATVRPFSAKRKESTQKKFTGQYIYKQDPWAALDSMVHNDLKVIYLHQPTAILKEQVKLANKAGIMPDSAATWLNKYMRHVIYEQPTELTQAANREVYRLLSTAPGKAIVKMAAKLNVDFGENPVNGFANFWGQTISRSLIGFSAKQALRNATQFLYSFGMNDTASVARAMYSDRTKDELLDTLLSKSQYRKMAVGVAEEGMSATAQGRFDQAAFGLFQKSSQVSVDISMKASYYQAKEYILNPKYADLGWADDAGKAMRKSNPKALSATEVDRIAKNMDFEGMHTNFAYNVFGLPMVYRSGVARPFFKLVSYPMQYTYQYLGELTHRALHGRPGWAGVDGPRLPVMARAGIAKHLIGLGMAVSALQKFAGVDYSSVLGISYDPNSDKAVPISPGGILSVRPSPAVSLLQTVAGLFSDDGYTQRRSINALTNINPLKNAVTSLLIPGAGSARQVASAVDRQDVSALLLYKVKEPKKRKPRVAFGGMSAGRGQATGPFGGGPFGNGNNGGPFGGGPFG